MLLPGSSGEMNRVDTFSGPTLRMFRVQRRQMGSYLCIASNDVPPAVSKRVTLNINFSPKVQVQKPLVGAPVAALVKLRCEVEAFPNANNYWMTEKNDVLLDGAKYHIQEKRFGYKTIMVLTIFNLTSSDFGTYSCVASNTVGKSNGSVRVYEIKIITTTTTTTTTTTPAPTTTTTTTTETNIVLEITNSDRSGGSQFNRNSMIGLQVPEEDPSENWLFPSVAPAPLELETLSGSSASSSRLCRVLFVATLMTFSLGLR